MKNIFLRLLTWSCWTTRYEAAQPSVFDIVNLGTFALAHKNYAFQSLRQLSFVGFCTFQKIYEATEGSRVQKVSTSNSSIAETNFRIFAGFTEGSQGSWEWYMKVKKRYFLCFLQKERSPQILPGPAIFET